MTLLTSLAPEVDAVAVGFDPQRLARLDDYLDAFVASGQQKGSLVVLTRHGKIAHVSSCGYRDEAAGLPVEPDTIWRIFSMTKPITSVAALMLYEEGALSLFDPVAKYIPAFERVRVYRKGSAAACITAPAAEPMLVWHLMTHTSGMTYEFMFNHPVDEMYRNAGFMLGQAENYTLEEACDRWAAIPLLFEPGTAWSYSHATDVLGRIVELVSGQSLDEFFAARIFQPLGMRDTGFWVSSESDRRRVGVLYSLNPKTGEIQPTPATVARERPMFLAGGHGLVSTAADYHRFSQMLLRRGELDGVRLLAPLTVDMMTSNHLPGGATITSSFARTLGTGVSNEGRGFGLGVAPLVDPIAAKTLAPAGEYFWGGAARTLFWVDPAHDLTALFFTQVFFGPDEIWTTLRRLVYQALIDA
ncbi:MAG: beta-lactamase family protein [Chloroflexi bacterium]|nr:beta-lactamase family protein [Chloroflexota bacterium]